MQVILLERIAKLGQMGDEVRVKDGFARNFLLPSGKALRANKQNRAKFEEQRAELEARNSERKEAAEAVAKNLNGQSFVVVRSAGETGQLYGSVSTRDISMILDEADFKVAKNQIDLRLPIKTIGLTEVLVNLHPEVQATITMNIARTADEAVRQAAGEDLTRGMYDDDDAAADDEDQADDPDFDDEDDDNASDEEAATEE